MITVKKEVKRLDSDEGRLGKEQQTLEGSMKNNDLNIGIEKYDQDIYHEASAIKDESHNLEE